MLIKRENSAGIPPASRPQPLEVQNLKPKASKRDASTAVYISNENAIINKIGNPNPHGRSLMVRYNPRQCLPSSAELPDSDDTPVDNELQNLIPNLLEAILALAWKQREDWFFGVDKFYHFPQHAFCRVKIGYYTVFERSDCFQVFVCFFVHHHSFFPYRYYFISVAVNSYYRRFVHN
jgi:hypothetical protein